MSRLENFITDIKTGLTIEEVEYRYNNGLVNYNTNSETKSFKDIILENTFTLFNIINIVLAFAIVLVGSYKNLLFMVIVIANTLISIFQQIRSKKTLDKLKVTINAKILTRRVGTDNYLRPDEIVKDDIIILKQGNQVLVDSIIRDGKVEVDESFITGESDTIYKKTGDTILSGSFIVGGNCICQVIHVGKENYTYTIASDTKYIKPVSSEIMKSLNKIVKTISLLLLPLAVLLFYRQLFLDGNNISNAVVNTTAALIGMIPEGLVLLTSTVLAVSVYNLSKKNVLVQDLYCIETLARVDTLCLDKTGTITKGELEVVGCEKFDENLDEIISLILENTKEENQTALALRDKFGKKCNIEVLDVINFSSKRKASGVKTKNATYLMGAPEFVLDVNLLKKYKKNIDEYSSKYRLICVVEKKNKIKLLGFVMLRDKIREDINETLNYFKDEGVTLKIISGDNPLTVKSIAKRAGMTNLKTIDASTLKSEEDIVNAILNYDIFGRVSPQQKKDFVIALQNNGHTVAMTGDGVNDVLALKEADCSIALSNGSDATKNVSQLVLLDSKFSTMPDIVKEGRRTINNIERSSSLFLAKTVYASLLSVLFVFIERSYPFIPIQLTLASAATIGIPSFMLSFEPNNDRVEGSFLSNVLKKSIPTALSITTIIMFITVLGYLFDLPYKDTSTISVFMTGYLTFMLLYNISKPLNKFRKGLIISMVILFVYGFIFMKDTFSYADISLHLIVITLISIIISHYLYKLIEKWFNILLKKIKQDN